MSLHAPKDPESIPGDTLRISIVASQYNASFVDAMVLQAEKKITSLAPQATVNVIRVPGAFEIPLTVKLIAEEQEPDAILALGVIIRGETAHADLIADAISQHLLDISLHYSLPVIHEILLLNNEEQAAARCLEDGFNRGAEAASTALSMIKIIENIHPF